MHAVSLRCFPEADDRFRRDALGALKSSRLTNDRSLEAALRRWYPACVVHVQSDLATLGEAPLWYAYRDGQAHPAIARSERLYEALGRSRDLIASTLDAVDRAATSPAANRPRIGRTVDELHARFDGAASRDTTRSAPSR
ncbi:MAG TPA: hypothetical protein VGK63_06680 [Candidatus Limnocylindrales bacterium]